ncbi:hypothetical protein [Streptomyces sp. OK228]|uniref:hypothetical protein n=1 Tax=Streptomyces sp. OK228 TaxID=1882786 RepID=UPI000BD81A90|nr:hypothetical protein [Streptomyces sp. OK228]SOE24870.1 hypothetical protein SAMN05442782_1529 [Streptomyces sp. OK228]
MSWYAADPVLAGLPTLAEWARAHGTQLGQPVLLRTELDRRTDNNTQRSPVRSLPTSIT